MLVVSVLCVATTYRGRGLATRLVRDLLRTATSSDCQAAAVIVSSQHSERFVMMNELRRQSIKHTFFRIFSKETNLQLISSSFKLISCLFKHLKIVEAAGYVWESVEYLIWKGSRRWRRSHYPGHWHWWSSTSQSLAEEIAWDSLMEAGQLLVCLRSCYRDENVNNRVSCRQDEAVTIRVS